MPPANRKHYKNDTFEFLVRSETIKWMRIWPFYTLNHRKAQMKLEFKWIIPPRGTQSCANFMVLGWFGREIASIAWCAWKFHFCT